MAKAPSLAERIKQTCADAEAFIDRRAWEEKASAAGQSQPVESLRAMLTRHDDCACRVALRLMEQKQ